MDPITENRPVNSVTRQDSLSQASETSQTAAEFISSQLKLEADAREALPYAFDSCTQPLGALRQILFSCLTCNPPKPSDEPYDAAGICYSCSIACHGEHELVELFNKRNFVCDCGTTRLPSSSPCTLRADAQTGEKGVKSEQPAASNRYNQNFQNRFCDCERSYDAENQRGTMYQCLGLGVVEEGGCGEDWWHTSCIMGLGPDWHANEKVSEAQEDEATLAEESKEDAVPPGFPDEDDFDIFVCYKCVDANPWIKRYANSKAALPPIFKQAKSDVEAPNSPTATEPAPTNKKRKAENDVLPDAESPKKLKSDSDTEDATASTSHLPSVAPTSLPLHTTLPQPPKGSFSLFFRENFRDNLCRCAECFPSLSVRPQLLEEEDSYEPPRSETDEGDGAGSSVGTGSLLDRGEKALNNVDRVRAIEGVMAYNHLKDKVKSFLQPFAESGQAVGADDIKKYFEQLRGDTEAMKDANRKAANGNTGGDDEHDGGSSKKEQSGY